MPSPQASSLAEGFLRAYTARPGGPPTTGRDLWGDQPRDTAKADPPAPPPTLPPAGCLGAGWLCAWRGGGGGFESSRRDPVRESFSHPNPYAHFANSICGCLMQIQLSPFAGKL